MVGWLKRTRVALFLALAAWCRARPDSPRLLPPANHSARLSPPTLSLPSPAMNARLVARSMPALARPATLAPRAVQPLAMAKRFASSEAIGPELVSERNHHKEHAGSEWDHVQRTTHTALTLAHLPTHPFRVCRAVAQGVHLPLRPGL